MTQCEKCFVNYGIYSECMVWSVFTVRTKKAWSLVTHWAHSKESDQTGWSPGWSESLLGSHPLLVLSWSGSFVQNCHQVYPRLSKNSVYDHSHLRWLDTLGRFLTISYMEDNFWVQAHQAYFWKGSPLKGKNLLPLGSKVFPFRVDPCSKKKQNIFVRVASPQSVSFLLKKC